MSLLAAAAQRGGTQTDAGAGHDAGPGGPRYGEVAALLISQVMLACMASGFRSWARAVEIWGKALPQVIGALTDSTGQTNGDPEVMTRRLDGLRASLRELAELPTGEFLRLQADLERIALDVRSATSREPAPDASPYWRRWRVKP